MFGLFRKKIGDMLPGRVLTEKEDLFCYGFDASSTEDIPSAVVMPVNTQEVSEIAAFAFNHKIPLIPRGAGTGMTGGAVPLRDTVVISLEGMNRIIDIDEKNMLAVVEPGVINYNLQEKLEEKGLFYPPDPASMKFCTLGGNVAENAGGPRAIKYGVTRDYVLGLEAVLPDGRVLSTGGKTYKGVVGYDLTRLLTGSEGTLGINYYKDFLENPAHAGRDRDSFMYLFTTGCRRAGSKQDHILCHNPAHPRIYGP